MTPDARILRRALLQELVSWGGITIRRDPRTGRIFWEFVCLVCPSVERTAYIDVEDGTGGCYVCDTRYSWTAIAELLGLGFGEWSRTDA